MTTPILRRSLAVPLSSGKSQFILPCKKLIFEYCETWGSNKGMKQTISNNLIQLARNNPSVEVVLKRVDNRHPHLRGVYLNGRDKVICVRNLPPPSILAKAQLLLDSSGAKITSLKRPQVDSTTESVRGIWSPFHES
ncbi:large subunit ribosomal protein L43, partial [Phenoliferia sp. Uapishka_3]